MPVFILKIGRMKLNRPLCSVEVVEETTMLLSWAYTWELDIKTANKAPINRFEMGFFIGLNK
jgi:hypothetical protein